MNSALLQLSAYALNALWMVAFFWAAAWLLARAFKRAGLEWEHKLWVATLLLSVIAPAAPLIKSYLGSAPHAAPSGPAVAAAAMQTTATSANLAVILPPAAIYLIAGLYLAAFLFFCVRLVWTIRSTVTLVRKAQPISGATLWTQAQQSFSLRNVAILRSPTLRGPVAAGFREPVLLLPEGFIESHTPEEFLAAAGHECAHIQRQDFRKNIAYEIASLFTAFHPLTWLVKSNIAQTREMICDAMAADRLLNRKAYAISLLQLASKISFAGTSPSHAMGMFDANVLEQRIDALTTSRPRFASRAAKVVALLALLLCAAATWPLAQTVAAQSSAFMQELYPLLGKQELACTYYENGQPYAGTCWLDEEELQLYRCYLNEDPTRKNKQSACEWKVQRYLNAKK